MMQRILTALALSLPLLAHAGGTAQLSGNDGNGRAYSATVEYANDGLRAASPQSPGNYVIAHGNKIYSVARINGQQVVMEAADLMRMAGGLMPSPTAALDQVSAVESLQSTTRRETVAGIAGNIYVLTYRDGQDQRRTENLVLTTDPAAAELTAAVLRLGRQLATLAGTRLPPGTDDLSQRLQSGNLGLLRFGSQFQVTALDRAVPPPSRFDLPGGSLQIPNLNNLFQGLGGR